jgi:N-acetylglucosaminyl-diphospho-decaprenol L-rhamnosyltransferase
VADTVTRVTLITVLYGGRESIGDCIQSALIAALQADLELEVILVDNQPGDGTADAALMVAPDATVIPNAENVGFGRACNQGFAVASGDWWLLLNPDAALDPLALQRMLAFIAAHDRAGAVGATLTSPGRNRATSGGMQPGLRSAMGHFWLLNRLLPGDRGGSWRGLLLHRRDGLGPRRAEWASGGALLASPQAIREVGGFDPTFFLYAEDVDLGRRLGDVGWETWLLPDATGAHSLSASSGGMTDRWYVALHDYHAKRTGRVPLALFDLIAGTGMALRAVTTGHGRHRRAMLLAAKTAMRLAIRP